MEHKYLEPIGQRAVFYIPAKKLEMKVPHGRILRKVEKTIHDFFITHYSAYTFDSYQSMGFWRKDYEDEPIHDELIRYEVSFDESVDNFINFLAELCSLIEEECIYLTMGSHSYLVKPKSTPTEKK